MICTICKIDQKRPRLATLQANSLQCSAKKRPYTSKRRLSTNENENRLDGHACSNGAAEFCVTPTSLLLPTSSVWRCSESARRNCKPGLSPYRRSNLKHVRRRSLHFFHFRCEHPKPLGMRQPSCPKYESRTAFRIVAPQVELPDGMK